MAKQTRTFSRTRVERSTIPFELVHSDVCGPIGTKSLGGATYYIIYVDDCTKYTDVYFLNRKVTNPFLPLVCARNERRLKPPSTGRSPQQKCDKVVALRDRILRVVAYASQGVVAKRMLVAATFARWRLLPRRIYSLLATGADKLMQTESEVSEKLKNYLGKTKSMDGKSSVSDAITGLASTQTDW